MKTTSNRIYYHKVQDHSLLGMAKKCKYIDILII
jgi:hypothetical protein